MVKELVIYPDERVNIACTDVRKFDEKLHEVLQNMKDTMQAHNLEALSAIQIAIPYNIIVIKHEDEYLEFINPRIIKTEGKFDSVEKTLYYPDITQTISRYEKIKVVYENRFGNPKYQDISDPKLSATLQRKIDYLFGGTFLDKLNKAQRQNVLDALAKNGLAVSQEVCPVFSKKDYFVSFTDKLLIVMGLTLIAPLFTSKETVATLYAIDKILLPTILVLIIGFFFYAQYEAKKYRQCSSCQIGNNIGVIIKRSVAAIILSIAAYFVLG
ncbi:MAG: peptide deformylase [Campylobacterales bacterium]|nr:peptide deformylase [Campylobacterales bacterium]